MNHASRLLTAAMTASAGRRPQSFGEDQPAKQWVWLESQGVWGYGYQIQEGPHRGLWRVDPDSKRAPEDVEPDDRPVWLCRHLESIPSRSRAAPTRVRSRAFSLGSEQQRSAVEPGHGPPRHSQLLPELPPGMRPTPPAWLRPGWSLAVIARTCWPRRLPASESPTAPVPTGP